MRPDDRRALPIDPELESLVADLEAAGARAHQARSQDPAERPAASFAVSLRERLLAELPAASASTGPSLVFVDEPIRSIQPPRVAWRAPALMSAPRWLGMAVAAALVVSVVGFRALRPVPAAPSARATDVVGAVLLRSGAATELVSGTELLAGDEVRVGADGHATLALGGSRARLDSGADVAIEELSADRLALDQLAGRVYHRVDVPSGSTYTVATASVTWTAVGTAFDIAWQGDHAIRGLAIEHDLKLAGPDLAAMVTEGRAATVELRGPVDVAIGGIDAAELDDPWLLDNAAQDDAAGFDLGVLEDPATPSPSPTSAPASSSPTEGPPASASPDAPQSSPSPEASATATPEPTPRATPRPTPRPTPKPTPKPTPTPAPPLPALSLALTPCPGGFVFVDWSAFEGDGFNHYQTVRSTSSSIPARYPPAAPGVAPESLYRTDPGATSGVDGDLNPGTKYFYRAMAFGADDRVIAKSSIKSVVASGLKSLGGLVVSGPSGALDFGWTPFDGPESCFTFYKLVWSATSSEPSYLGERDGAIAIEPQGASSYTDGSIGSGTYWFRVQVIASTEIGKFVVAQTDSVQYVVP